MKIKAILQWLFVYLPVRFTVPFLGLLAWFLFYLWPWLLDVVFPVEPGNDIRDTLRAWLAEWLLPGWIDVLNLRPAAKAVAILALLGGGLLLVYNVAALWYQGIRKWRRERLLIGTILLNVFIYSYPWIFAPKDWAEGAYFWVPFYIRTSWIDGFGRYGILWLLPAATILATLTFELFVRMNAADRIPGRVRLTDLPPVKNDSFDDLRKDIKDLRIGLILSGGGAKGVYQAGAMKAIHEFLRQKNSLGNVRMIAGTSIGAWNTMFWLADMVGTDPGKVSPHEQWWSTTSIERIIEFDKYIPVLSMRMAYLYNNLNALRNGKQSAAVSSGKMVRVFAICPEQPLAVNTGEFWKTECFASAFQTMYDATRVELSKFNFMAMPAVTTKDHHEWLRMALVSQAGEITYNYRF